MPVKDTQEWPVLRPKFDVCGYRRGGGWMSGSQKFLKFSQTS